MQVETSTSYRIGTSDHNYITLSFKTKGNLCRRLISAFSKSALKKTLKETNLEAYNFPNGYLNLSEDLSKAIKSKPIQHKSFIRFNASNISDTEKMISGNESLTTNSKFLWNLYQELLYSYASQRQNLQKNSILLSKKYWE